MDNGDGFVDEELIDEIIQECLDLMEEPEKTQAIPATKVMGALIGTTSKPRACIIYTDTDYICRKGYRARVVGDCSTSSQDVPGSRGNHTPS